MEHQREAGFLSNQAQHQVIWLMSSASPAEGGLISQTSCCAVWLDLPIPYVKAASETISAAAPNLFNTVVAFILAILSRVNL